MVFIVTNLDLGTHVQRAKGWLAVRYGKPVNEDIIANYMGDDQMLKI